MERTERAKLIYKHGGGEKDNTSCPTRHCSRKPHHARLAILVVTIVAVVVFISAAVVLGTVVGISKRSSASSGGKLLGLDDVFNSSLAVKTYQPTWTKDGRLLQVSPTSGVTLFSPALNTTQTIVDAPRWQTIANGTLYNPTVISLSWNNDYLLLAENQTQVYRHSFLAYYYIYQCSTGNLWPLVYNTSVQYATWSPTRNQIVYVADYTVFLYDLASNASTSISLPGTGPGTRYGIPDWVYEEEVLSSNSAIWWAPDGVKILYAAFNDSLVQDFQFPIYGPQSQIYTTLESIPYPKAGSANPLVSLYVCDTTAGKNTLLTIQPPVSIASDHYFVYAGWINSSVAMVTWTNRTQTAAVYCAYDVTTGNGCLEVYTETSKAWVQLEQSPFFFGNGSRFLTLASQPVSTDSFKHILEVSVESGQPRSRFLTTGAWVVTGIIGVVSGGDDVLYTSTQKSPWQSHVYSTKYGSCLTCEQTGWGLPLASPNPSISNKCEYFVASCDPATTYCVIQCKGPALPYSLLVHYEGGTFKAVNLLEPNSLLHQTLPGYLLPTVDTFTVPSSGLEPPLYGRILYPPSFVPTQRYPVLIYVYGGPNSQTIANTSIVSSLWQLYFVSNLNLLLVSVDGRGTGFRGDNFMDVVYRQLGLYETVDQIRAARYLQGLPFVDSSKIAIYGASYGGYMAGMVGSSGSGVFKAAISQSPVTDWRYYDSVYTERYMGLPTSSDGGEQRYLNSSLLLRATNLAQVSYLLIHGTADDNVHFQNTAQLLQALTVGGVQFQLQVYTDKAHSLSGDSTKRHLYTLIADFLIRSFR
ncbi:hypothetical protein EMCRGX_G023232 [Ephydatia muelleri]